MRREGRTVIEPVTGHMDKAGRPIEPGDIVRSTAGTLFVAMGNPWLPQEGLMFRRVSPIQAIWWYARELGDIEVVGDVFDLVRHAVSEGRI